MKTINFPYGSQNVPLTFPDGMDFDSILPPRISTQATGRGLVEYALQNPSSPINTQKIINANRVCIAINDKTRPVPYPEIVPPLLDYLNALGITSEKITFLVSTGTHIPATGPELDMTLPPQLRRQSLIFSHDCDDQGSLVYLGLTTSGTPVEINQTFHESDYRIVLGSIEPHHFMGYSGGVKTAAIGLTSRKTIRHNHAHLTSPLAYTGNALTNPCRVDVEEIGKIIGIDLALNVILDSSKQIIHALAGDPLTVMEYGIPLSQQTCQVPVAKKYDLVIVSPGGYPKDINFYQAHKAVTNAASITRDGGMVILLAECRDGPGSRPFQQFMKGLQSPDEILRKFEQTGFEIGPHKAYLLARQLKRIHLSVYSSIEDPVARSLLLNPISIQEIITRIDTCRKTHASVAVMPYGVNTVPIAGGDGI